MTIYQENTAEPDLGVRQLKWFDWLSYQSHPFILETTRQNGDNWSKWVKYSDTILPATHRLPIPGEYVIDFDSIQKRSNYKRAKILIQHIQKTSLCDNYYITDHNGKGPHVHIFYLEPNIVKVLLKFSRTKIAEVLTGRHMARAIGGLYKNGKTYNSYFPTLDDIRPITRKEDVRFPSGFNPQHGRL